MAIVKKYRRVATPTMAYRKCKKALIKQDIEMHLSDHTYKDRLRGSSH